MNLKRIGKLFGLGVALAILALAAGNGGQIGAAQAGCTVTLKPGESIQNAIDNVSPGAVICLSEGSWLENLIITKDNLTLRGQGRNETVVAGEFVIKVSQRFIVENMTLQSALFPPPCDRTVQPGESIAFWIDRAQKGEVIRLAEGTWEENLKIEKSLTLRGAGKEKTIIKGKYYGPVILIESDSEIEVILEGLTIAEAKSDGIEICGKAKATIKDSTISGSLNGLVVRHYAKVSLVNSTVSGNRDDGLEVWHYANVSIVNSTVSENGYDGLYNGYDSYWVEASANVSLVNSTVSGNGGKGLEVTIFTNVSIVNSTVSGNGDAGLDVWHYANVSIVNSTVSGNRNDGLRVGDSANVSLTNSTVSGNRGYGLRVGDSANVSLQDSTISGNEENGLYVGGSAKATIKGSTIEKNGTSAYCTKADYICNGILVNNESQTTIIDSIIRNNTHWGVAARLRKCGYREDIFNGEVIFQGNNQIYGNGKGDVCLP